MIKNSELLAEIIASKKSGVISRRLAQLFVELVTKLGKKGNFNGYSYLDDMQSEALLQLVKSYDKFDENRFSNAHAYLTACCWNSFVRYLKHEKKASDIRNSLVMASGELPSYSAQLDYEVAEWGDGNPPPSEGIVAKKRRGRPPKSKAPEG